CVDTTRFADYTDFHEYKKRSRKIMCVIEMDFQTSMSFIYRREFTSYLWLRFMEKCEALRNLMIAEFDIDAYSADVNSFFEDYIKTHEEGGLTLRQPTDRKDPFEDILYGNSTPDA